jgi:hypothetical protein
MKNSKYCFIPLTREKVTIIDREDYDKVKKYKWHAHKQPNKNRFIFYAVARNEEQPISLHRLITNAKTGEEVDHINGCGLDNRKSNLRIATSQENHRNSRKRLRYKNKPTTSKYKGVYWNSRDKIWQSRITRNSKLIYLGSFDNEKEAASAYDAKAVEIFGKFARTNFILNEEIEET